MGWRTRDASLERMYVCVCVCVKSYFEMLLFCYAAYPLDFFFGYKFEFVVSVHFFSAAALNSNGVSCAVCGFGAYVESVISMLKEYRLVARNSRHRHR